MVGSTPYSVRNVRGTEVRSTVKWHRPERWCNRSLDEIMETATAGPLLLLVNKFKRLIT